MAAGKEIKRLRESGIKKISAETLAGYMNVDAAKLRKWYYLTSASTGVPTLMQSEDLKNRFMSGFYQASLDNMDFFVDANIAAGTASIVQCSARKPLPLTFVRGSPSTRNGMPHSPVSAHGSSTLRWFTATAFIAQPTAYSSWAKQPKN